MADIMKITTSPIRYHSKEDSCSEFHGDYDKDMQVNPSKLWKFEAFVETLNSDSGNTVLGKDMKAETLHCMAPNWPKIIFFPDFSSSQNVCP